MFHACQFINHGKSIKAERKKSKAVQAEEAGGRQAGRWKKKGSCMCVCANLQPPTPGRQVESSVHACMRNMPKSAYGRGRTSTSILSEGEERGRQGREKGREEKGRHARQVVAGRHVMYVYVNCRCAGVQESARTHTLYIALSRCYEVYTPTPRLLLDRKVVER